MDRYGPNKSYMLYVYYMRIRNSADREPALTLL